MSEIEFHADARWMRECPAPYPAARGVPEWLKTMPMGTDEVPTLKRCPPFLQALTAGYVIPAPAELQFRTDAAGNLSFKVDGPWLERQAPEQYPGAPFVNSQLVKFINPWLLRTPEGYSTLFCHPLNRFDMPFIILAGLVETDRFYRQVHFPAVCIMRPGFTFTVAKGAPLVQAVPIRRETWQSRQIEADVSRVEEIRAEGRANPHAYKEQYWQKLEYR